MFCVSPPNKFIPFPLTSFGCLLVFIFRCVRFLPVTEFLSQRIDQDVMFNQQFILTIDRCVL